MTLQTISPAAAVTITAVFILVTAAVESKTLAAKDHSEHAARKIDMAYCTKCHSDSAMLAKMKRKEGNAHFLFNGDDPIPVECAAAKARQGY